MQNIKRFYDKPYMTIGIIVVNIIVFVLMSISGRVKSKFVCKFIFQLCGFIYATFIFKRFD